MTSYQPGIPTGTVPLNQDYLNLQNNFKQLDTTYGVNHVKYSVATNNGKHNFVEMPNGGLPAGLAANEGTVYCKSVSGVTELFFTRDASGVEVQLTSGSTAPVRNSNGYSFLPGGMMLQWGFSTLLNPGASNISFTPNFANVVGFAPIVTIAPYSISGSGPSNQVVITGTFNNQFNYHNFSTEITNIYWMAVGPI